jgi:inhibitor of cysteine peptidase
MMIRFISSRRLGTTLAMFASLMILGGPAMQGTAVSQGRQTETIEISYDELLQQKYVTRDVSMAVGDVLVVRLASNPSTGFRWTSGARIGDPTVLQQTNHQRVGPTASTPGACGAEVWTFEASKAGATTIATDYNRPWVGGAQGEWTFRASVVVQ